MAGQRKLHYLIYDPHAAYNGEKNFVIEPSIWTNTCKTNLHKVCLNNSSKEMDDIIFVHRGLIHETGLRAKLRPKPKVRNYRRKVAIHESGQRGVAT